MAPSGKKNDEVQVPWITKEFLEEVLRGEDDLSNLSVTSRDIELAVGKGDNYLSILYRVRVQFKQTGSDQVHSRQLITKALPMGDHMQNFVREAGLFDSELKLYNVILPALYRLQESSGVEYLTARCFRTSRPDTLVLEDLRPQGFVMSERRNRLDLPHCRLVIRSLARLHGLSAVLIHREPALLADVTNKLFCDTNRHNLANLYVPQLKDVAGNVAIWPGYERFAPKLLALLPTFVDRMIKVAKTVPGEFKVLNHGDCWVNNLLFKYSPTGEVVDMRFVDFQVSWVSSPVFDLQYFLCASPQDVVRECHLDQLLHEYHETLCTTVGALDPAIKVLSFRRLLKELNRTAFFGFATSLMMLAAIVGDPNDAPDMAEFKEEDAGHVNVYGLVQKRPEFQEPFKKLLIAFEKAGIFQ